MALSATLKRVFFLAGVALAALVSVDATQVMHRPAAYKDAPRKFATGAAETKIVHKRADTKVQAAYFTNWCVAGSDIGRACLLITFTTH